MAELYFIKLHPVIARINLYNAICRKPEDILHFLPEDQNAFLEVLKSKAKENVENLSNEELSCIVAWAKKLADANQEDLQTRLFINGIDIFHQITEPNTADQFVDIFSEYQEISGERFGTHMKPDQFSYFLIYGILFTSMFNPHALNETAQYLKKEFSKQFEMAERQYALHRQTDHGKDFSALHADFTALYDLIRFSKDHITLLRYSS